MRDLDRGVDRARREDVGEPNDLVRDLVAAPSLLIDVRGRDRLEHFERADRSRLGIERERRDVRPRIERAVFRHELVIRRLHRLLELLDLSVGARAIEHRRHDCAPRIANADQPNDATHALDVDPAVLPLRRDVDHFAIEAHALDRPARPSRSSPGLNGPRGDERLRRRRGRGGGLVAVLRQDGLQCGFEPRRQGVVALRPFHRVVIRPVLRAGRRFPTEHELRVVGVPCRPVDVDGRQCAPTRVLGLGRGPLRLQRGLNEALGIESLPLAGFELLQHDQISHDLRLGALDERAVRPARESHSPDEVRL